MFAPPIRTFSNNSLYGGFEEMATTTISQASDLWNLLLEAERAGATVLNELIPQAEDPRLRELLKRFLKDEGVNCRILTTLIEHLDAEPSKETGAFVGKVKALGSLPERVELLIKGQEWVARKKREFRHVIPAGSPHLFLEAIKVQHEENVDALKKMAGGLP
jgi:hypothetical protein